jgi:hypothetical protein
VLEFLASPQNRHQKTQSVATHFEGRYETAPMYIAPSESLVTAQCGIHEAAGMVCMLLEAGEVITTSKQLSGTVSFVSFVCYVSFGLREHS